MTMQPCTVHVGHNSCCSYFTGNLWTTHPTVDNAEATHLGGCQYHNREQAEKATDFPPPPETEMTLFISTK